MSLVLFGILVSSVGPIVRRVSIASRVNEQRRVAQLELANLMEQIATLPPEQLNEENVEALRATAGEASSLAEAELVASVSDETDGLRRVGLALSWKPDTGGGMKPVRLTAWFRSASPQPEDAS